MHATNAFIGRIAQPTDAEIASALGPALDLWRLFIDWLSKQGVREQEWKSSSTKYGWSLRMKLKKRTIVYLGPCAGCFRVAFVLGNRAVEAASKSDLPRSVKEAIEASPRYAEGTGLLLFVRHVNDLPAIKQLVDIKMTH